MKFHALIFFIVSFLLLANVSLATKGVDVSQSISSSAFKCLKNNGFDFAIVRCGRSSGSPDPNCASNVQNAWGAGMAHVDAYIFPCPSCGNGASQVINTVRAYGGKSVGMLWLDIEGPQYWSSNQGTNRAFFNSMLDGARQAGVRVGVYTSSSQWNPIMGSWSGGSAYPLWYAHYDNSPSFSDFRSFGGWSKPAMKQYQGDQSQCGVGIDLNVY
ncbi:glycoside hydrolase family 25 protein [Cavenderia fasciculata]|uniref:lysozyme n=1 Tax=Cavenderia fasciculata TaxID=261658 RepID=F4PZT8_CACFS|nr:glycoside hydrolase family 25 protein [Cavenderia fasciculata]EGG18852.1 glycoside hydrolase family 25 protein [Cavenderia fasciculata]|eukprot:XP_004357314.1 glycoside hydrolase family 25 protein [Cavenderia fasciculata]